MSEGRVLFCEVPDPCVGVGCEVVIPLLCRFRDPVPRIVRWRVIPSVRQVGGTEFLGGHGKGTEELIVQFCESFRPRFIRPRHIQGVVVLQERGEVVVPGHLVLRQPAVSLEHALREDDLHL